MNKTVLLVNPFASARYMSEQFKFYNVKTLALYTVNFNDIPDYVKPPCDLFDEQIRLNTDDIKTIVSYIPKIQIDYVINGFESSVELSDKLAMHYTPELANDYKTYKLRSNKYEMHKALSNNGLSHIKQYLFNYKTDKLLQLKEYNLDYPCFIKPLAGAASIGTNRINNDLEYKDYFKKIDKYKNFFQNSENEEQFLISEYVNGEELILDTFSVKGIHHISSIQRYKKEFINGRPVYRYCEIEKNDLVIQKVEKYIRKVLDATNFLNGFAHSELFLLPSGDVKLIEINPRISGMSGMISHIADLANGTGLITLLVYHIFNNNIYIRENLKKYRILCLLNLNGNPLSNLQTHLKEYKTVTKVIQIAKDGYVVKDINNVSLTDICAFVLLASNSSNEIEEDTKSIFYKDDVVGWN